ncbi:MAG: metallophosphoesterase, partial [Nocardioidaceae bacterium]|nr:metallophosphoesterase [Nocardioidaceae bacterium]
VYAFALGSKLRRTAQVSVVTFKDGQPVGIQPVDFEITGDVVPQSYVDFTTLVPAATLP